MNNYWKVLRWVIVVLTITSQANCDGLFGTNEHHIKDSDLHHLNRISNEDLKTSVRLGVDSVSKEDRLEQNILQFQITVLNGSISHAQLLETFPTEKSRKDHEIAQKILKSSLYLANSECRPKNVTPRSCERFLAEKDIPETELRTECLSVGHSLKEGHRAFRRLLPARYQDGFHSMFTPQGGVSPRKISVLGFHSAADAIHTGNHDEEANKNIALIQWTQFIEHDLVKSVVTSMKNGVPIECCSANHFPLTPRYIHPACAPLEGVPHKNKDESVSCLNYVRSALAVDPKCRFGAANQVNQATGYLDLSQVYGFTKKSEKKLRSYHGGKLKASIGPDGEIFLPMAGLKTKFCVLSSNSVDSCFMAGDTRVNSNPYMTILYTLFLRSHNQIAAKLKLQQPSWNDEMLYQEAKRVNVNIYRDIVFNEWLPIVIGRENADKINSKPLVAVNLNETDFRISNEFGVAAMRFYYSMMPNTLKHHHKHHKTENRVEDTVASSISTTTESLFALKDEFYQSGFLSNSAQFENSLEAILNQKALKMDSSYAESLIKNYLRTNASDKKISGADALAWDIQRGRDHGLQGYVKYLQVCSGRQIASWDDLHAFITEKNIQKLKSVYSSVEDIDLIIGGISEIPENGSTLGPTFTCILNEQFSKIRQLQFNLDSNQHIYRPLGNYTARRFLCETSQLTAVPENIFLIPSETNPLVPC